MIKVIKSYIKTSDICDCIKFICHNLYEKLSAFFLLQVLFIDLILDFIIDIPISELHNIIYNSIFIIMYYYTKFVYYILAQIN